MLLTRLMEKPRNDNNPLEFQPLEIAVTRIVKRLENDKSEQGDQRHGDQPSPREKEEDAAESHRSYVEQRVRETKMWERRINPKE